MKILTTLLAALILNSTFLILHSHAASYTWTGTTSTAWGTNTNWSPNGVPGAGDNVTIVSATNAPLYDGVAGVTNLTMTSGTLDLNGYTLNMTGTGAFNGGAITNGKISSTGGTTTFAGTTFNCKVRTVGANLFLNGSVFNDSTYVEQTGTNNNSSVGGNKYNAFTEVVLSGTGNWYGSYTSPYKPDTASADIKFTKKSSAYLYPCRSGTGHQLNGKVILNATTSSSGILGIGQTATVEYNGDIEVNNSIGTTIIIGGSAAGNQTLASGKKLVVGSGGFSSGTLSIYKLVQQGSTRQAFTLTGTSILSFYSNSTFNAPVDVKAGAVNLNGTWFKDTLKLEETNGSGIGTGPNKFDGPTTITNSGSGYFISTSTYPDTFNNSLSLIYKGSGSSYIMIPYNNSGTYFGGNVKVKCTTSGSIYLGNNNTTSKSTLKAGKKLLVDTFNVGTLYIQGLTQLGDTAQSITLTGSASLYSRYNSVFNANSYFEAPNIYVGDSKFNKKSTFKKTGGGNNSWSGGNIFNDTLVLTNNTSAGYLLMCNTTRDTCNSAVYLTNSGTSHIYMNYNQPCIYNGDIYVAGAGTGNTYFGASTGTATLASGKTIKEGAAGFTAGTLILRNFTKNGTTAINLDIGNAAITFSTGNTLNGDVTVSAGAIYLNGTIFNHNVDLLKTGTTFASSTGGNTFNGTFKLRHTGTGYMVLANSTTLSDIFNGDAEFINEATGTGGSSGHLFPAYKGPANQFNGSKVILTVSSSADRGIYIAQYGATAFNCNIEVNNTSTSGGKIDFGEYSGVSTLASGKSISVGSLGFSIGSLTFRGFKQLGTTAINVSTTGSSYVWFRKSTDTPSNRSSFDATVTISAPRIFLNGAIFKDDASFTSTGAFTHTNDGDNEYQGDFSFNDTGTGNKTFANVTRDIYMGNATFTSSSGTFYIAHKGINTFSGNITTNGSPNFYFANSGGQVVMDGDAPHIIKKINGSTTRTFTLNKPGDYTSTFKNLLLSNDAIGRMW